MNKYYPLLEISDIKYDGLHEISSWLSALKYTRIKTESDRLRSRRKQDLYRISFCRTKELRSRFLSLGYHKNKK